MRQEIDKILRGRIQTSRSAAVPPSGFSRFRINDNNANRGSVVLVQNNAVTVDAVGDGHITFSSAQGGFDFSYVVLGNTGKVTADVEIEKFLLIDNDNNFLDIGNGNFLEI